jgi:hypothetical protein
MQDDSLLVLLEQTPRSPRVRLRKGDHSRRTTAAGPKDWCRMRFHIANRRGYDRWVDEDDFVMLIGQDGTAVTSLLDGYSNEALLSPEQTEQAIEELQEEL